MLQHQDTFSIPTRGRGLTDITRAVQTIVAKAGVATGLCTVFCAHTSCSLLIQENADLAVQRDLLAWLARVAPDGDPRYEHDAEGPDDMAAHLRATITRSSESIPVRGGRLALGTWQALYLVEHRTSPHERTMIVHVTGA